MASEQPPKKPRRTISAKLAPIKATGSDVKAPPPTAEQIAVWQSLGPDQKMAVREREAVRMFIDGLARHNDGDLEEAARLYGQALALNPNIPDIYINLGVALRALGKPEASAACYHRALALSPDNASAYTNLGNVLRGLGQLEAAVANLRRAAELNPDSADIHYNLGLALRDTGQLDETLECFAKTLAMHPDHSGCHFDRALTLLQKGDLKQGFAEYEWRWKLGNNAPRDFSQPQWDGEALGGKTILLHAEQGFGDMIQFARYIALVKERGGTIIVEAQPPLSRLFSTIEGVGQVVNTGADLPRFDVWTPMLSLARIFGTAEGMVPADVPYLNAPEAFGGQLPATLSSQLKVGIAWAGNASHQNDARRSCPFNHFTELMGLADVALYSLQTGRAAGDIAGHGCQAFVTDLGGKMNDFADTAAAIDQLDLIISVDTAVAHLAGAMAKPVWVALPHPGDWRWMQGSDTSPWYPTMQLFRQPAPGDWASVFAALKTALATEAGGKTA